MTDQMVSEEYAAWEEERKKTYASRNGHPTRVRLTDVEDDLLRLGEDTSTGEYGYNRDDDGALILEVWNDSYHGVKTEYKVKITLEKVWGTEDYSAAG